MASSSDASLTPSDSIIFYYFVETHWNKYENQIFKLVTQHWQSLKRVIAATKNVMNKSYILNLYILRDILSTFTV